MASVNKVILVGNLGNDPEVRTMQNGTTVTTISIATTERYKDKDTAEIKESTEWHKVVMYNKTADIARQYLSKGAPIYIEGRLRTRKWQSKDGIERYSTEISCDQMQMLSRKSDNTSYQEPKKSAKLTSSRNSYQDAKNGTNDDIPF